MMTTSDQYSGPKKAAVPVSGETYRIVRLAAADRGLSATKLMEEIIKNFADAERPKFDSAAST